jgi:hypothetical protein
VFGSELAFVAIGGALPGSLRAIAEPAAVAPVFADAVRVAGLGLILGLCTFRMVFTFREYWAAISHVSSYLSGGDPDRRNRVHAASVLRFFAEVLLFWILFASFTFVIFSLISDLPGGRVDLFGRRYAAGFLAAVLGMAVYVLLVFGAMKTFAGDGDFATDRLKAERAAHALWLEDSGTPREERRKRARTATGFAVLLILLALFQFCGMDPLSREALFGLSLALPFYLFAATRRARISLSGTEPKG